MKNKKMDKAEKAALVQAWKKQHKIFRDIRDLAEMNVFLAYGCIRAAETMIDMIMVAKARESMEKGTKPKAANEG